MLIFAGPMGTVASFLNPRLNEKPRDVHLYCTLMAYRNHRGFREKIMLTANENYMINEE